jgi:DNA-binding PadR family transcriptional regulator
MGKGTHMGEFEELILLAVAGLGDGGHGAAIHEAILEATGRDVSVPAVYVTLARLEKKGLVSSSVGSGGEERGGRPRKLFAVTQTAIAQLRAARQSRDVLWSEIDFDPMPTGGAT